MSYKVCRELKNCCPWDIVGLVLRKKIKMQIFRIPSKIGQEIHLLTIAT